MWIGKTEKNPHGLSLHDDDSHTASLSHVCNEEFLRLPMAESQAKAKRTTTTSAGWTAKASCRYEGPYANRRDDDTTAGQAKPNQSVRAKMLGNKNSVWEEKDEWKFKKKGGEEKKYKDRKSQLTGKEKKNTMTKYEEKSFTSLLLMLTQYTVYIYIYISICNYACMPSWMCVWLCVCTVCIESLCFHAQKWNPLETEYTGRV